MGMKISKLPTDEPNGDKPEDDPAEIKAEFVRSVVLDDINREGAIARAIGRMVTQRKF